MAKHILMLPERFHSDVKIFGRGDLTIFVIDHAYITSQYKLGCGGRGCNCYIYSSTFMVCTCTLNRFFFNTHVCIMQNR